MIECARRPAPGLIVGISLIAGAFPLPGAVPAAAETVPASIGFVVHRDGTPIGTHRLRFHTEPGPDGERLIVDVDIDIRVKAAFITLYRYTFKGRETWHDGKLIAFDSATDDNGRKLQVHVRADGGVLKVDSTESHYTAPADTLLDSYWRPDTVKHQRFIDTEDGKLVDLVSTPAGHRTINVAGKPADLAMYNLAGEIDGEIGYASDGEWMTLRLTSHGSDILYTREPPAPPASVRQPQ